MPIKFATKNVPFKTPKALSLRVMETKSHDSEPIRKQTYPILKNNIATAKEPKILVAVPNQETKVIIFCESPLSDIYRVLAHIVP